MPTEISNVITEYPNDGFGTYWRNVIRSPYKSKIWFNIHKTFQLAGLILKDAGIELFFLLIFWLIITKMGQGRDIIVGLFEPEGIYSKWRVFWTVLSAASLSLSMWAIPAFIFQLKDRKNRHRKSYQSAFKVHLFFAHRVLPLVPFWLLASVLFNQNGMTWLFIGLSALQIILLYWFYKKIKSRSSRLLYGAGILIMLIGSILWFRNVHKVEYTQAKIALSVILYLVAFLLHLFFHERDLEILNKNRETDDKSKSTFWKYKVNSLLYSVFLTIQVGLIILFFTDVRLDLAPESIMLFIFSFYVLLIDLFVYIVSFTLRRKFSVFMILIAILLIYYYSPDVDFNLKHYTLDKNSDSSVLQGKQRLTFEKKYADLKTAIDSNKTGRPYPIILISGEGGGSRAGLWFSQNIINFDYYTRGKFREHIFAISTVSGSSVGLSTLFTFWEMAGEKDIDTGWLEFPLNVYSNNFVGTSVKGMLLTDLWRSIPPFSSGEKDRNSALQDEEAFFTQRAVYQTFKGTKPTNIPEEEQILRKDFMNFFYAPSGDSLIFKKRPLVFINSCRSNDGRRGIISPIKLPDDVFNDAVDIAGYLYEDSVCNFQNSRLCYTNKSNISLGQACNLSELFPLFSAPAYIDSLGSFVDGGYHENSGLKTTLDVYQQLKKNLDRDRVQKKKYEIFILYFKNGDGKKDLYKGMKSELPFSLPLKALTSQPFAGSASYFEEKARFIDNTDTNINFFSIQLDNEIIKDTTKIYTSEKEKKDQEIEEQILNDLRTEKDRNALSFPLARWLSKSVIKRMRLATFPVKVRPQKDDVRLVSLLEKIDSFHKVTPAPFQPFRKWTPYADRLRQEQKIEKAIVPAQ